MSIPVPIIREIGPGAETAVQVEKVLLTKRNQDDSYGKHCTIDGKAFITIAVIHAFVEEGTPQDSDRLRNSYEWLMLNATKCQEIDAALIRATSSIGMGKKEYEGLIPDTSKLRQIIRDSRETFNWGKTTEILLAIECLHELNETDKNIMQLMRRFLHKILTSNRITPADRAYAVQLACSYDGVDVETVDNALVRIDEEYDPGDKLWRSCAVETAYTIIDLSYISGDKPLNDKLKEKIVSATDELIRLFQNDRLSESAKNFPSTIVNVYDREIYVQALTLRAIVRCNSIYSDKINFALMFAHAFIRDLYKLIDGKEKSNRSFYNLASIGFIVLSAIISVSALVYGIVSGFNNILKAVMGISALIPVANLARQAYKWISSKAKDD